VNTDLHPNKTTDLQVFLLQKNTVGFSGHFYSSLVQGALYGLGKIITLVC